MPTGLGDEQLWLSATNDNTGTSTAFNDQSGEGNNGTAVGTLVVADTSEGGSYAFDLDGTNDYISVPQANFSFLRETNQWSQSAWVKLDSITGQRTIIGGELRTSNYGTALFQGTSGRGLRGNRADGLTPYSPDTQSGTDLTVSQWTHVCWVVDDTTSTIYLDGVQLFQETGTFTTSSGPLSSNVFVGCFSDVGTRLSFFDGLIDDVRIFDRPLAQAEITHLASQRGVEGPAWTGLGDEKLWLCPSINDSANDISGSGNDGTYQNGMGTISDVSNGGSLAYDLAVNEDRIEVTGIGGSWRSSGAWTISMWLKGMLAQNNQALVLNNNVNIYRGSVSGETIQSQQLNPGIGTGYIATGVATGTWYHLVCTSDGTNIKMYADGVEFKSITAGLATTNTGDMIIGSTAAGSPSGTPIVRLDDIRAYDRALTQAEITHLAEARGIEGPPPVGLGDEQLWLCPSLNDSANDISGNGNDGTYNGGMGTVADTGEGGSLAYDFDGADDYIDTSNVLGLGSGDFSISFWVKSSSSLQGTLLSTYNQTNGKWISIELNGDVNGGIDVGKVRAGIDDNTTKKLTGTYTASYNDGTWRHLVVERNNTDGQLRVRHEGVSVSSVAIGGYGDITSTAPFRFGSNNTVSSGFFDGAMDDIRVYDRVLTQAEIAHLASSRGIEGPPPVGLGDETLWLCASLNQSSPTSEISGAGLTITEEIATGGTISIVEDTGAGGTHSVEFANSPSHCELAIDNFGNTYSEVTSVSWWSRRTAGSVVIEMGLGTNLWPTAASGRFYYENWVGADRAYMYNTSGGTNGWIDETGSNSTWKHHVMVREGVGGKNRLYINGVLDTQEHDDGGAETTGLDFYFGLGGSSSASSELYVDDIRTYGRVLTQAEITHLATSRGIEGPAGTPPVTPDVFFNPFQSKTFFPNYTRRIR